MSKAQKSSKASEEKKKTPAAATAGKDKAKAKTVVKAKSETKIKIAAVKKPAAPAKVEKKPAAKPDKKSKPIEAEAKADKQPKKPAAATKSKSSTSKVERLAQNQASKDYPSLKVQGFINAGLGVKTSNKKPALSIAPGVMILGKASVVKTDAPEKTIERKLSKKELGDIKTLLLEKRERLVAGMRRELAVQRERAESKAADEVDKATDAYDEDLSFEIATANDQELGEIQVALEKIDKGTYGECEICGCTISPSRLKILPSATTCVSCRGQEEMSRRRDDGNLLFTTMMAGEDGDTESGDL